MQKPLRKARTLVVAGVAAGSFALLTTSPAAAIGVRPVDPTSQPAPTAPPPNPNPPALWSAPAPTPPAAPALPVAPAPRPVMPKSKFQLEDPTFQPASTAPQR
jgi:hypothetical protein